MQQPTCTNVRIRSTQDAHRIFYAVQKGMLQMVARRLDANERLALRTGCVYAWEERGPHNEITGLGIERFTEGRRWSPSRVRDEFLFYYEKYTAHPDGNQQPGAIPDSQPPRDWDGLVKQTYSVWVETDKGRRKWHLTAYFTQTTVDDLGTIDDIPGVKDLVVPAELFQSTRVAKSRGKSNEPLSQSETSAKPSSSGVARTYAPFSSLYNRYPSQSESPPASEAVLMYEPYGNMNYNPYPPQYPPVPVNPQPALTPAVDTQQYPQSASVQPHGATISIPSPSLPYNGAISVDAISSNPVDAHPGVGYQFPPDLHHPSPSWNGAPTQVPYPEQMPPSNDTPRNFSPYGYQQGTYPLPPVHTVPNIHPPQVYPDSYFPSDPRYVPAAPPNQRISPPRTSSLHQEAPTEVAEPCYELSSADPDDDGRRGSIGPDRDLAPIQALTRRHPYRRDPLDDKALRLLPR